MIKEHPGLVSEGLYNGTTNPICRASYLGYRKLIIILLENGADVNQRSSDGRTPVMWAAFRGNIPTMELLIERGADLTLEDKNGLNAFDVALCQMLYTPVYWLYSEHGMRPKDQELYAKNMVAATGFDFELMFKYLESGRESAERIEFF